MQLFMNAIDRQQTMADGGWRQRMVEMVMNQMLRIVNQYNMQTHQEEIRKGIEDHSRIKEHIHTLIKDLKYNSRHGPYMLQETIEYLQSILREPSEHPVFKLNACKFFMYLILMGQPQVYDQLQNKILPIFKGNCLYNRKVQLQSKGEDFFKKSKYYVESKSSSEKSKIKDAGIKYVIFSHQIIYHLAKWIPVDSEDSNIQTKFSKTFKSLVEQGIQFPKQENLIFFLPSTIQQIEHEIKEIEKQLYSSMKSESEINIGSVGELYLNSQKGYNPGSHNYNFERTPSKTHQERVKQLEALNEELRNKLKQQKQHYEEKIVRQEQEKEENIQKYQSKISLLGEELEKMREKMAYLETKTIVHTEKNESKKYSFSLTEEKDRIIDDLTKKNHFLENKVKALQSRIEHDQSKKQPSSSGEDRQLMEKLKKQNKVLKAKLLTQCEETTEFKSKEKGINSTAKQTENSYQFIGYQDAKASFQPFYSNSSSENKIRLRKAILRDKELLYRDKNIEVGCISKLQLRDTVRMVVVCTNVSQKPIFEFMLQFVSREDVSVRMITQPREYLEIGGQTKAQLLVTIKNIDFRCLLCSIKCTIEVKEQKIALILPLSKLKLAKELVFTPVSEKKALSKIQKIVNPDRKILPTLSKFKEYYKYALLEKDRTNHETYHLKLQFLSCKFYVECDEVGSELRLAVKYEAKYLAEGEKLLEELVFIFSK